MKNQETWISETMDLTDRIQPPVPSADLMERLHRIPQVVKQTYDRVPKRTIWLAAASIAALIAFNLFSFLSSDSNTSNDSEVANTYFNHMNHL